MKYLSIAALVAVGAIMMGCNKLEEQPLQNDNNTVTLTTTVSMDASTKALTAAGVKTFAAEDQIAVIYKNTSNETVKAVSEVIGTGAGTASATFTVTLTNPDKTKAIRYIYPAAMAKATVATNATIDDDGTVDFTNLNTQNGLLTTLGSNLDLSTFDAASWGGDVLPNGTLSNQLAILALTLKNSTGSSDITSTITGVTLSDGTNSYAVTRSAAAGPIYVAIQPTTSAAISVTATTGTTNYTKSLTGKTYAAGNGYSVSWRMAEVVHLFTIDNKGTKVVFAPGNLRYTSGAWSFFDNQWDYYTTYSADSWDKFGWSTSATTYGMNTSTSNSTYSGDFVDWGATIGSGWRTLTSAEWQYLFNTRTTGGTVFGTAQARYAHATINTDDTSVNGMILFPDGVDIASTEVTTAGSVNATSSWVTRCTTAQWAALAAKGCVFLPAAGCRNESSVNSAGSYGYYWSSLPSGTNYAYRVYFYSGYLDPANYYNRYGGLSVRLVRQVE